MVDTNAVDIDFETYYDDDYTAQKLSTWNYVFDERFDAYLVAIYGSGFDFVGSPRDFDWSQLHGFVWVMHNAGFDGLVVERLKRDKLVPGTLAPSRYFDTADMAAFLRVPRKLKDAARLLLDHEVDKSVRAFMKGVRFETLDPTKQEAVKAYARNDAMTGFALYEKRRHLWPEVEQRVSELNLLASWRGIPVDPRKVEDARLNLTTLLWQVEKLLPWVNPEPGGPQEAKPMSPAAPRRQGVLDGIPVPSSFDSKDPAVIAWEKEYGPRFPWVRVRRHYGRINTLLQRVRNFQKNLRDDNTLYYQCKYHGAGPGRFSGGSENEDGRESGEKFNVQNMPRDVMFSLPQRHEFMAYTDAELADPTNDWGINLRGFITAPDGYVLGTYDYAQIEARILLWRCGDKATLKLIRETGMSIYEAYARTKLGWKGGKLKVEDPNLYRLAKALVLGAGYQCWANAFQKAAFILANGLELDLARCEDVIRAYRAANPLVVQYWEEHKKWLRFSITRGDSTHEVRLASGRKLTYFEPQWGPKDQYGRTSMRARIVRGENFRTFFGGKLTENEIQATARDILVEAWVALADKLPQAPVLFSVHDELVLLLPENEAASLDGEIKRLMITSSPWAEGCPLEVESAVSKVYTK